LRLSIHSIFINNGGQYKQCTTAPGTINLNFVWENETSRTSNKNKTNWRGKFSESRE